MKLKNDDTRNKYVENNKDSYGSVCIKVARRVMELRDDGREFEPYEIIGQADDETDAGGINTSVATAVGSMVWQCHERGEEFKQKWDLELKVGTGGEGGEV